MTGIYGRVGDDFKPIEIDNSTHSIQTIEYEHHEIHEGNHFFVAGETTLDNTDIFDSQLTTPDTTKWIHMNFEFASTQEILLEIYEDADVSADGTSITPLNNNRNSSNTTDLTLIQTDGTVNTAGTKIYAKRVGIAGDGGESRQGLSERSNEIILKQNSTYRFVFTSGGDGNNFTYLSDWYEHTNKD